MGSGFRTEQSDDGIAIWTFDRPEARNAIDESVVAGLDRSPGRCGARPQPARGGAHGRRRRGVRLGRRLKFLRDASPERRALNDSRMLGTDGSSGSPPVPVIAALNGAVIGGGSEIAFACDLRIAEPHATITMKHAAMGVSPGWGGLARLAGLVGRSARASSCSRRFPWARKRRCAWAWWMSWSAGGTRERALELAQAIAKNSPSTVAEMKRLCG